MQLRVIVFVDRFRYFPVQVCGRDVSSGGGLANISVVGSINRSRVSVVFINSVYFTLFILLFPFANLFPTYYSCYYCCNEEKCRAREVSYNGRRLPARGNSLTPNMLHRNVCTRKSPSPIPT